MDTRTVTAMAIQLMATDTIIPPMDTATAMPMPHQSATDTVMDTRTGAMDTLIIVTSMRIRIMRELITSDTTRRDLH